MDIELGEQEMTCPILFKGMAYSHHVLNFLQGTSGKNFDIYVSRVQSIWDRVGYNENIVGFLVV